LEKSFFVDRYLSIVDVNRILNNNHMVRGSYCPIELATLENTWLEFDPTSRSVPTTITRITAGITAYSAMSCLLLATTIGETAWVYSKLQVVKLTCVLTVSFVSHPTNDLINRASCLTESPFNEPTYSSIKRRAARQGTLFRDQSTTSFFSLRHLRYKRASQMVGSTFGHGNYFPHVNEILRPCPRAALVTLGHVLR
jgi:hypothetical protein